MNKYITEIKIFNYLKLKLYYFITSNKLIMLNWKKNNQNNQNNYNNSHKRRCTLILLALLYDIPIIVGDVRSQNMLICKKEIYYKNEKNIEILISDKSMIPNENKLNYVIVDESVGWNDLMSFIIPYSKKHIGYIYKPIEQYKGDKK